MQQYLDLLQNIIDNGEDHEDRTGVGTLSLFIEQIKFDLGDGFPLLTTKKLHTKSIFKELLWFIRGSSDNTELQREGVSIWDEWSIAEKCAEFGRSENDLGPIYGPLWRAFPSDTCKVDQLKNLFKWIENSPNSRRLIVSGWHPFHCERVTLAPCHTLYQLKIHNNSKEMSLHLYARSIDTLLGLPYNIASYALLLSMIAHHTGYMPRNLGISFGDVHLYKNHLEQAHLQLSRKPRKLPKLNLLCPPNGGFDGFLNTKYEDILIENYNPCPSIKAPVAI